LEKTFATLREAKRTALMPYLTMGYPERDSALTLVPAIAEAGADLIELGVPFSDPLADGATIQAASQQALANGMSLDLCLDQAADLRHHGTEIPFVLMGYYNPIYQYGIERFAQRAAASGIDGLIVPDLPPEESGGIQEPLRSAGIDLVFLLAPTSSETRIRQVVETSGGFVYLVSLVGVTGARSQLDQGLSAFVRRVRTATDKPLAVGFGISRPEQAAAVARIADGVIVGSALIKAIGSADDPVTAAQSFTRSLREGINGAS
jgi:tryptophan synthase alpha chain